MFDTKYNKKWAQLVSISQLKSPYTLDTCFDWLRFTVKGHMTWKLLKKHINTKSNKDKTYS